MSSFKKFLLFSIFIVQSIHSNAQDSRAWSFGIEGNYLYNAEKFQYDYNSKYSGLQGQVHVYRRLNEHVALDLNTGYMSFDERNFIPLTVGIVSQLWKRKTEWATAVNLGYSWADHSYLDAWSWGGVRMSFNPKVFFPIGSRDSSIGITATYTLQEIKYYPITIFAPFQSSEMSHILGVGLEFRL